MAVGYTEGSGRQIASDAVGAVDYQVIKLDVGTAGAAALLSAANPLPVTSGASYAEDAPHTSGDKGTFFLGVRADSDASPVSADGDYHALLFNQFGRAKVSSLPGDVDQQVGAIAANGATVVLDTKRLGNAALMVSGTFAGVTLVFEGSLDGSNWFSIQAARTAGNVVESTTGSLSASPTYAWLFGCASYAFVRVRATTFTSGSQSITWKGGANSTEPAPIIASFGQKTSALSAPVVLASDQSVIPVRTAPLAGTDRSVTASTTTAVLMAANTTRTKFYVKNDSTIDVWINIGAAAVATAGAGNIRIAANGGYFEFAGSSSAINIIAASATAPITAREF